MKYRILLPLAALAAGSTVAAESIDTVVVTATRIAQTVDQALVPVSVLTREDIERSPASSLPELLSQLPGVDFTHNGGHGKTASLFVRGTNSDHVLVLIDGIRSGSATLGSFAFEQIPLAHIERVELVRGPRSSLYGAEAIGGVLQIFTRKGREGASGDAHIASGNHGTREAAASLRVGDEKTRLGINLAHFETDGIDSRVGDNPDDDGYENRSFGFNLEQVLSDALSAEIQFMHVESENHYDDTWAPTADNYADNLQQTMGLRLANEVNESLTFSGGLHQFKDESEAFDSWPSDIKTRRRAADFKADIYLDNEQLFSIGADYYYEDVSNSTVTFTRDSRHNTAFFAQWQNRFGPLSVLAGARSDDSSSYGRNNTANLNLGYEVATGHRLLASYGTAFKAPTFNDLYYPWSGDPDLEPEESSSFEVSYEGSAGELDYALRAYRMEIDNLIEWRVDDSDNWFVTNIDPVIKGLEFELGTQYSGWVWAAQASLLDTEDRNNGGRLINRAEQSLKFDISRVYNSFEWTMTLAAYGDRESIRGEELAGYGVVNLTTRYRIDSNWSAAAKLTNILDKDYATTADYNGLDRTVLLTLSYSR